MKTFKITKRFMAIVAIVLVSTVSAMAQTVRKHVVERGETLASIAGKYAVSKDDIVKLNPDAAQFVYVGMELQIPEGGKQINNAGGSQETSQFISDSSAEKAKSTESETVVNNPDNMSLVRQGSDFFLEYLSDAKMYGLGWNIDINKYFVFHFDVCSNLKFGHDNMHMTYCLMGLGLHQRFCFNDNFMLGIKAYPYAGFNGYDTINDKWEKELKNEFIYGAKAEASLGIKLFTNKSGNDVYLTVGYSLMAADFKTEGMFDSGMIILGYSVIY